MRRKKRPLRGNERFVILGVCLVAVLVMLGIIRLAEATQRRAGFELW